MPKPEAPAAVTEDPTPETERASNVVKIATVAAVGLATVAAVCVAFVKSRKSVAVEGEVVVAEEETPAA